jgi:hypothetical protein
VEKTHISHGTRYLASGIDVTVDMTNSLQPCTTQKM